MPKTTPDTHVTITLPEEWQALCLKIEARLIEQGRAHKGRARSVAIRFGLACAAEELGIKTKLKP